MLAISALGAVRVKQVDYKTFKSLKLIIKHSKILYTLFTFIKLNWNLDLDCRHVSQFKSKKGTIMK